LHMKLPIPFVLMTVMIDAIGIGIIIPVFPDLMLEVSGGTIADAALWGGSLAAAFAIMQLLCSPTVGNLSDRFGRRPVLLVSLLVLGIDYIIMGIAHTLWLLFLGRIVGGIAASTPATAAAFIADVSRAEDKAQNFGLLGAAFGAGFVFGPLVGAVFAEFGTRAPFYTAAGFTFANLLLGYFVLPETVTERLRRPFEWRRANPIGGLLHLGKLPGMKTLLVVFLLYHIVYAVYPAIWSFWGIERFGWDARMIGISLAIYGVTTVIVQGWGIRFVLTRLSERQTMFLGIVLEIIGLVGFAFIDREWLVFALIPVSSCGALALPAMQGIMSRIADVNQQGELQGLSASLISFANVIAPIAMTAIFSIFIDGTLPIYLPGAPFLFSAVLALFCILLIAVRTSESSRHNQKGASLHKPSHG